MRIWKYIFTLLVLVCLTIWRAVFSLEKANFHIIACNVGQGDAILAYYKTTQILVDGGPDKKVLDCLAAYLPFWDREIEAVILTHPQKDHFFGFSYLIDRYQIDKFYLSAYSGIINNSYQTLKKKMTNKKIPLLFPMAGAKIKIINDSISFIWPTQEFLENNLKKSFNSNDYSLVFIFQENNFRALFTGDASPLVLSKLLQQNNLKSNILKIQHHGSKNGLINEFLLLADPKVSVISAGKNNSYGHPHQEVLAMLKAKKTKIMRTDEEGNIVFKIRN